ncbi:MAG: LytTR family transcriptional regulator DNA-binding domain-containing protein [Clostridium sp.]|uniref:LytR/AlgR family response regulator transcription factor n=2 Tax=Clostridium sp. TaxID=1506 RepID=UPI002FCAC663
MIKVNLILKDAKLEGILKLKIKSFFTQKCKKVQFVNSLENEDSNDNLVIIFFELRNGDEIKLVKDIKDKFQNSAIIFLSEKDNLVFQSLSVQPLQFIRLSKFEEDFKEMLIALEDYLNKADNILTFKVGTVTMKLNIKNIIFIESYGHYLIIHSTTGNYKIRERISKIVERIKCPLLIRVHKSYIINTSFVEKALCDKLILKSDIEIPIGRCFKEDVIKGFSTISN